MDETKKKILIGVVIAFLVGIIAFLIIYNIQQDKKRKAYEEEEANVGIIRVNDETFSKEVLESDKPVILEFTSNTCPPCLSLMPTLISIARNNDDIKVVTVNTDESDSSNLEAKYGINSTPTILIFRDGKVINKIIGAASEDKILSVLR